MKRWMWVLAAAAAAALLLTGAERVTIQRQQPARPPMGAAPLQNTRIVRDPAFIHGIHARQRFERTPHRHYWHRRNGVRYSHYYDGRAHWYGFYQGPRFYWTRYHANRWWWFDVNYNRWLFWGNGYWWWPGPAGASYVYIDNNYYPYERSVVAPGAPPETPESIPPPPASAP